MQKQIRPGGVKSSVFSLIILCLGAGTLTIPYVFSTNGIVVGTLLICFGACLSLYTGWLVVVCCHKVNASRYEDLAMSTFGVKFTRFTSACMLLCLIGFVVSYIVLVRRYFLLIILQFKELLPYTLVKITRGNLPDILSHSKNG